MKNIEKFMRAFFIMGILQVLFVALYFISLYTNPIIATLLILPYGIAMLVFWIIQMKASYKIYNGKE